MAAALVPRPFLFLRPGLAQDVTYNALPGTNFAAFHTYQWANCGNATRTASLTPKSNRISTPCLGRRGSRKVAPETKSDLSVCYQTAVQQERQWNAFGMEGCGSAVGWAKLPVQPLITERWYLMFTLWRKRTGMARPCYEDHQPERQRTKELKNMQNGINKLLKNFPPPAGK